MVRTHNLAGFRVDSGGSVLHLIGDVIDDLILIFNLRSNPHRELLLASYDLRQTLEAFILLLQNLRLLTAECLDRRGILQDLVVFVVVEEFRSLASRFKKCRTG